MAFGLKQFRINYNNRKLYKLLVLLAMFIFIRSAVVSIAHQREQYVWNNNQWTKPRPQVRHFNRTATHKILLWIIYESEFKLVHERECMKRCPVPCDVTNNVAEIDSSSAVVFTLTSMWPDNWKIGTRKLIDLPKFRHKDQVWILANREPPPNMFGNLRVLNGIFNWTMWHRSDADLYFPYFLPTLINNNKTESKGAQPTNVYKSKTKEITGKISNCRDSGRRYRLVNKLQKYLFIDMFGKCYDNVCGVPEDHRSCDTIREQYKFYLGLENSQCKDFVTGKYWWALIRNQIPIVNWDYSFVNSDNVIPNSFISINNFQDIETLAQFVKNVSSNESLYNSYFTWRSSYRIEAPCASCIICKALHEGRPRKVVHNIDTWILNDTCPQVGVS